MGGSRTSEAPEIPLESTICESVRRARTGSPAPIGNLDQLDLLACVEERPETQAESARHGRGVPTCRRSSVASSVCWVSTILESSRRPSASDLAAASRRSSASDVASSLRGTDERSRTSGTPRIRERLALDGGHLVQDDQGDQEWSLMEVISSGSGQRPAAERPVRWAAGQKSQRPP